MENKGNETNEGSTFPEPFPPVITSTYAYLPKTTIFLLEVCNGKILSSFFNNTVEFLDKSLHIS